MVYTLRPGQCISHFEIVGELGSGAFATVYTCFDRSSLLPQSRKPTHETAPLALKVISKKDLDEEQLELTRLEATLHAGLPAHKNIVQLLEWFEDNHALYIVLERCAHGDLYDLVTLAKLGKSPQQLPSPISPSMKLSSAAAGSHGLPDPIVKRYLLQLIDAIDACHAVEVYHRDIKLENCLLDGAFVQGYPASLKLADFGLATHARFSTELGLGTRAYLAPECLDESIDGYLSAPADVFAIALVGVQLAFPGLRLWRSTAADDSDYAAFARAPLRFFQQRHPQIAPAFQRVLARALDTDVSRRCSLRQLRRMIDQLDVFACKYTPSLLVAPMAHMPCRLPAAASSAVPTPADAVGLFSSPTISARSDISDMDFMMHHHEDDDADNDYYDDTEYHSSSLEYISDSELDDQDDEAWSQATECDPAPVATAPPAINLIPSSVPHANDSKEGPAPLLTKMLAASAISVPSAPAGTSPSSIDWSTLDDDEEGDLFEWMAAVQANRNTPIPATPVATPISPTKPTDPQPISSLGSSCSDAAATADGVAPKQRYQSLDSALGVSLPSPARAALQAQHQAQDLIAAAVAQLQIQ